MCPVAFLPFHHTAPTAGTIVFRWKSVPCKTHYQYYYFVLFWAHSSFLSSASVSILLGLHRARYEERGEFQAPVRTSRQDGGSSGSITCSCGCWLCSKRHAGRPDRQDCCAGESYWKSLVLFLACMLHNYLLSDKGSFFVFCLFVWQLLSINHAHLSQQKKECQVSGRNNV